MKINNTITKIIIMRKTTPPITIPAIAPSDKGDTVGVGVNMMLGSIAHVPLTFSAVPVGHKHMKPHGLFTHTSVELQTAIKHSSISDNTQNNRSVN